MSFDSVGRGETSSVSHHCPEFKPQVGVWAVPPSAPAFSLADALEDVLAVRVDLQVGRGVLKGADNGR